VARWQCWQVTRRAGTVSAPASRLGLELDLDLGQVAQAVGAPGCR